MPRPVSSVKLLGKRWPVLYVARLSSWGECDGPNVRGRSIRISDEIGGRRELVTLICQMQRACCWPFDPKFVQQSSEDIGDALWRLGFRKLVDGHCDDDPSNVPVRTVTLLGKTWQLRWVSRLKNRWGDCDDPTARGRSIRISREAQGKRQLIVLIHEMMHGCSWPIDEDQYIEPASSDIGTALWRMGYRRVVNGYYDDTAKDPE